MSNDELAELGMHFNTMAKVIDERIKELENTKEQLANLNKTLETRIQERRDQLNSAHLDLAEAEKLASLGNLVAGISHELNTPIGNAVISSTLLDDLIETISDKFNSGQLRKSELEKFMAESKEISELVTKSVLRSAELIQNFKQISIDQISEKRRLFDLKEVVEVIIQTALPGMSIHNFEVKTDIISGILCDSYPGPLSKVLTNLIQNALTHGLANITDGRLLISATLNNSQVSLSVFDNGKGMTDQVLGHVFDPFFTTSLGKGGSGLGLAVCYRIVTNVLGGTMQVESKLGSGSCFIIKFPVVAPGAV